jgi:hypothetical protein
MPWLPLSEAVEALGASRATLERRIARDEIPSYLASDGRRLVWTGSPPEPALVALRDEIAGLRATLEALAARLAHAPPFAVEASSGTTAERAQGDVDDAAPLARLEESASESVPPPIAAPTPLALVPRAPTKRRAVTSEAEIAALFERIARLGVPDLDVSRGAGLSVSFLCKARAGGGRTSRAASSWASLRAWLEAQENAQRASA